MSDKNSPPDPVPETDNFVEAMQDVKPLRQPDKVALTRASESSIALEARRRAAVTEPLRDDNFLSSDYVELLDPYYPLEFRREGVQHGVFRKFKQGKYPLDARLDLHRMTVEEARREVFDFLRQAEAYDLRTAIIVHGKGAHSQSAGAVLKSYINKWLPELSAVQAFCSAQPQHGGVGAVYVMLRKSERKKQENRDRVNKGRRPID